MHCSIITEVHIEYLLISAVLIILLGFVRSFCPVNFKMD